MVHYTMTNNRSAQDRSTDASQQFWRHFQLSSRVTLLYPLIQMTRVTHLHIPFCPVLNVSRQLLLQISCPPHLRSIVWWQLESKFHEVYEWQILSVASFWNSMPVVLYGVSQPELDSDQWYQRRHMSFQHQDPRWLGPPVRFPPYTFRAVITQISMNILTLMTIHNQKR